MQWRLVEALNVPHSELFDPKEQKQDAWAVGLRAALERIPRTAKSLADSLGISEQRALAWQNLDQRVPHAWQSRIAAEVGVSQGALYSYNEPAGRPRWVSSEHAEIGGANRAELAAKLRVTAETLEAWSEGRAPVPPNKRTELAESLGLDPSQLFSNDQPQ